MALLISSCPPGLTGRRADEEDRERRGADLLRRPGQKGLSPLHRQPGHRVSLRTQEVLWLAHIQYTATSDQGWVVHEVLTPLFSYNERVESEVFLIIFHVKVGDLWEKCPAVIIKVICVKPLSFRTLYCAKGNYDFGISRVIKSLEPYNKKVSCFPQFASDTAAHRHLWLTVFTSAKF